MGTENSKVVFVTHPHCILVLYENNNGTLFHSVKVILIVNFHALHITKWVHMFFLLCNKIVSHLKEKKENLCTIHLETLNLTWTTQSFVYSQLGLNKILWKVCFVTLKQCARFKITGKLWIESSLTRSVTQRGSFKRLI